MSSQRQNRGLSQGMVYRLLAYSMVLTMALCGTRLAGAAALFQQITPTATVIVDRLNVRIGPGTGLQRIGEVKRGEQLTILDQYNNCAWLLVRTVDDMQGYVSGLPQHVTMNVACQELLALTNLVVATPTAGEAVPTPTATPHPTLNVAASQLDTKLLAPRQTLVNLLKNVHNRYQDQIEHGCLRLNVDATAYYAEVPKMTATLLTHPLAQSFSLGELADIFNAVVNFPFRPVKFVAGGDKAVLVILPWERGCYTGSHYIPGDLVYVVDEQGTIWNIKGETPLLVTNDWYIDGRWVLLATGKLNSFSNPSPYYLLQIGRREQQWELVVNHRFTPDLGGTSGTPTVHFANGYQTMIANLDYWSETDPCPLTAAFTERYRHGDWKTRQTFQLVDNRYQLVELQILDFVVYERNSGQVATVGWQDACVN